MPTVSTARIDQFAAEGFGEKTSAPANAENVAGNGKVRLLLNGKSEGSFTIAQLREMLAAGKITPDTLCVLPGSLSCKRVRVFLAK